MGKIKAFFKSLDHRHYICCGLIVLSILWIFFITPNSLTRFLESIRDLGTTFIYSIFNREEWCPSATVLESSTVDVISYIPKSWIDLFNNMDLFWKLLFDGYNFLRYLLWALPTLTVICQLVMVFAILILVVYTVNSVIGNSVPDSLYQVEVGVESSPLKFWKRLESMVFIPVKKYLVDLYEFFSTRWYFGVTLFLFLIGSNVLPILLEALSFVFYFIVFLSIEEIPMQFYKLSVDLIILWNSLPWIAWFFIFWRVLNVLTRAAALKRLNRQESHNEDVVRSFGLVVYLIARMRAGKTKMQASMKVTAAKVFRDDAFDNMISVHSHFPAFPFEKLINELNGLRTGEGFETLTHAEAYVYRLQERFDSSESSEDLFGYDFEKYGLTYDNGAVVLSVFDDLLVFVKSYMVYTEPTLFIANFSVREMHEMIEEPLLPSWDFNLFSKDSFDGDGEYARILDWDYLRPGKKMGSENVYGALEYGIIGAAEINKERGNKFDHEGVSKNDDSCNLKNDLCHKHLTMMGHAAMINYKCFIKMFTDGQRVVGWGADARDLSQVVTIVDASEERLALDLYYYRDMIYRMAKNLHSSWVSSHWYKHRDCKLINYLIDRILSHFCNVGERVYSRFGYKVQHIDVMDGTGDGEATRMLWYSSNKKEHGGLYATDSYSEYFRNTNMKAGFGLSSMDRYETLHPTLASMREKQHSFMIDDFCRDNEEDPNEVK